MTQREQGSEPETIELSEAEYSRLVSDADVGARAQAELEQIRPDALREMIRRAGVDPDSRDGRVLSEFAKHDRTLSSVEAFQRKAGELTLEAGQAPAPGGQTPPTPGDEAGYRPGWMSDESDIATKAHRRNAAMRAAASDVERQTEQARADRAARQEALDKMGAEYAGGGDGLTDSQRQILTSGESLDAQIRRAREQDDFMLASALERRKEREET